MNSEGRGRGCVFEVAFDICDVAPHAREFLLHSVRITPAPMSYTGDDFVSSAVCESTVASRDMVTKRMMGCCILVVDDSRLNRKFMNRLLSTSNYDVHVLEAEDGLVAEELLHSLSPTLASSKVDVILMDNRMPRKDGLQTTRELRSLGYRGIIIGVTGDAQEEDMKTFKAAGADAVLSKPITFRQLESCLINTWRNLL